jgi:hypothetical protein
LSRASDEEDRLLALTIIIRFAKKLSRDKHSSLFDLSVSGEEKKFFF